MSFDRHYLEGEFKYFLILEFGKRCLSRTHCGHETFHTFNERTHKALIYISMHNDPATHAQKH